MTNGIRNTRDRAVWKTWVRGRGLWRALIPVAVVALAGVALAQGPVSPGPLVVWGTNPPVPPVEDFVALAAGGQIQVLAIRGDGTLYLSSVVQPSLPAPQLPMIPEIPTALAGVQFSAVGVGRTHALAIRRDNGRIEAWPDPDTGLQGSPATRGTPTTGGFVAVTGNGSSSLALHQDGNVVVWGAGAAPAPAGLRFTAIAARLNYMLALGVDGNIYGWGADTRTFTNPADAWTPDGSGHFMAPREAGIPYTAIAAGLSLEQARTGLIVALRLDGRVVVWDPSGPSFNIGPPPAGVVFKQPDLLPSAAATIAAGSNYAVGIDEAGHLHAWGSKPALNFVPSGCYSTVSAALVHATAIAVPETPPAVTITTLDPGSLWPPNQKMKTVVLTFRADDCSPVALAGLSVTLRSNQPDNGSGSGNTTGDTNGHDGYTSDVPVPASAIVQNADGSFTATFQVRAERSNALPGTRIYTVSVVATDTATSPNTSAPMTAQIVVGNGGQ